MEKSAWKISGRRWGLSLVTGFTLVTGGPSFVAAAPAKGVEIFSKWVLTHGGPKGYELPPQERSRPVIVGDIVYYGNLDGRVVAVHRTEGYKLWERKLPNQASIDGAFAYGRSKLFVGDTLGNLYALHARDGSIAWTFKVQAEWLSPPVVIRDRVIAATSNDELFAIGEADGKEKWHYSRKGDEKMTIRGTSSPAVFGNEVFQGFSDGNLVALSGKDGKVLWTQKLRTRYRFYDIDMSPSVDQASVIAATFDGNLYSLDRTSGASNWVIPVGSYGGFLAEDDRIYFSGLDGNFYGINRKDGKILWTTPFEKGVGLTPARAGDYLVFTTSGDPLYVVDPKDGKIIARKRLGMGTMAAPVGHAEGWFYCLSNLGNLYAFEIFKGLTTMRGPETISGPSALLRLAKSDSNNATP